MSDILKSCASVVALCLILAACEAQARANVRVKVCRDVVDFYSWYCKKPDFTLPFDFSRPYIIKMYRPSYKHLYPFQHQAAKCCKVGCNGVELNKICRYEDLYATCDAIARRTNQRTINRAMCLLETERFFRTRSDWNRRLHQAPSQHTQ